MKISLESNVDLGEIFGQKGKAELEIQTATLRSVLQELSNRSQGRVDLIDRRTGDVDIDCFVFINGLLHYSLPRGLDTELKNGDEVKITFLGLGGG
jgi:molybdopterin converting factor small subunit